jgi:manganese/zinc/iron transport system permease protein
MNPTVDILLTAVVLATSCALLGSFLVLRQLAMVSDAITHAILPGIVVGFFLTQNLHSPLLVVGAAVTGVLTVALVELLERSGLVKGDAAVGLVFPFLFSVGVILIAQYAGDVHLDTDAVLLGELGLVHLDRLSAFGLDLGPRALWASGVMLAVNAAFVAVLFKELKLAAFDGALAAAFGFAPVALHYALMTLVSLTAVTAFDAAGSILVVAFIVGPATAASLFTRSLSRMIVWACGLGALSAVVGYGVSALFDVSIAGTIASTIGMSVGLAYLFAPDGGQVTQWRRRRTQRTRFGVRMLLVHLARHEGTRREAWESRTAHLEEHVGWEPDHSERVVAMALRQGFTTRDGDRLHLTESGRQIAEQSVVET